MSLLNFNFAMIYATHKILVSIKNHLNYRKDNSFECFFKKYKRLLFYFFLIIFLLTYNNGKCKA